MGKLKIKLINGQRDGDIFEETDSRKATEELKFTSHWLEEINGESNYFLSGPFSKNWVSVSVEVYKKVGKNRNDQFEYLYDRTEEYLRCNAITKKGDRCLNYAGLNSNQCKVHSKNKKRS